MSRTIILFFFTVIATGCSVRFGIWSHREEKNINKKRLLNILTIIAGIVAVALFIFSINVESPTIRHNEDYLIIKANDVLYDIEYQITNGEEYYSDDNWKIYDKENPIHSSEIKNNSTIYARAKFLFISSHEVYQEVYIIPENGFIYFSETDKPKESVASISAKNKQKESELETDIVKETVIVTEIVYVTEQNNKEEITTSEVDENKGYTTQDVLKKAAKAADNQYWIVYFGEDFCEGSLLMSTFNALEDYTVKWTADGEIVCDKMVGNSIIKDWNSDKSTFTSGMNVKRTDVAFRAYEIVGSNCDIYDEKNDLTISAKTN